MRAGSVATADSFPRPEAPALESIRRRGGQDGGVRHCAIQKPIGQGRVVPGVAPQLGVAGQALEIFRDIPCHIQRVFKASGIFASHVVHPANRQVREMPGNHKIDRLLFARFQGKALAHRTHKLVGQCARRMLAGRIAAICRGKYAVLLALQQGQCHGSKVGQLLQLSASCWGVAEDNLVDPDVAPSPRLAIDHLKRGFFSLECGQVQGFPAHLIRVVACHRRYHLAANPYIDAGAPVVVSAADPHICKPPHYLECRRRQRTGCAVLFANIPVWRRSVGVDHVFAFGP